MKYAHLYTKRGGGYELYVTETASMEGVWTPFCTVAGKREARAICERQGFIAYNF